MIYRFILAHPLGILVLPGWLMEHIRYQKIHTTLDRQQASTKKKKSSSSESNNRWCVTEKIHGANFSIYIQRNYEMKCAKRTGFLQENEIFFNYYQVIEKIRANLYSLAEDTFSVHENVDYIVVFGELFGGGYPGYDNCSPIQQGIWYSPMIEFAIFDICHHLNSNEMSYLPYSQTLALAEKHDLFVLKPLFIGSYHEASQYNVSFQSTIPSLLSLPLVNYPNQAEGVVIRELEASCPCNASRPILKIKSVEFSEGDGCPPGDLTDTHLKEWIHSLLNWNRLAAAISKVGSHEIVSNRNEIVQLVLEDILEETGLDTSEFRPYVDELKFIAYNLLARGDRRGQQDDRQLDS
jgi:Rnl2 family RNA ligase